MPSVMCHDIRTTQKNQQPYSTNNKEAKMEIGETSCFIIATNNIKYLGLTLAKEVKELFGRTLSL